MTQTITDEPSATEAAETRRERRRLAVHLVETFTVLFGPPLLMVLVMIYAIYRGYETSPTAEHGWSPQSAAPISAP